jgi:hypothetical protein
MKKLQNNFTTPEQSKRLLELGVPADSADCYYGLYKDLNVRRLGQLESNFFYKGDGICDTFLPCWSVGRLMEIYDICVENTESWPVVKQDISYVINTIVAIDYAVKEGRIDFSKLND